MKLRTELWLLLVSVCSALRPIFSNLLQRCVIYCHSIDTNGWYRRLHPTNDEKGE